MWVYASIAPSWLRLASGYRELALGFGQCGFRTVYLRFGFLVFGQCVVQFLLCDKPKLRFRGLLQASVRKVGRRVRDSARSISL